MTLVLVTKQVPAERIREAYEMGARDFGENRVQELLKKKSDLPADIRWHFQGRLQTNKVKSLLGEITLLHSLDRRELAEEIEKQAERKNLMVEALLEVNTSGEATKAGFQPEEMESVIAQLKGCRRITPQGLMTIGPFTTETEKIRTSFRRLRSLRDQLARQVSGGGFGELSMGMSSDFELAIEEGATLVRIGTAVFGERK